jgi:hypothetical protein
MTKSTQEPKLKGKAGRNIGHGRRSLTLGEDKYKERSFE